MTKSDKPEPKFVSPKTKATVVRILLVLCMLAAVARIGTGIIGIQFISKVQSGTRVTQSDGERVDQIDRITALAHTAAFFATGIGFLFWNFNMRKNLPALGAKDLKFNDIDANGSFMVPIVNLYTPFRAMQETWKASHPDALGAIEWKSVPASRLINLWWGFWIFKCILGLFLNFSAAILRMHREQMDLPSILSIFEFTTLHATLFLACSITAFIAIASLTKNQEEKHARMLESVAES